MMSNRKNKYIALIISLIMLFDFVPLSAFSEKAVVVDKSESQTVPILLDSEDETEEEEFWEEVISEHIDDYTVTVIITREAEFPIGTTVTITPLNSREYRNEAANVFDQNDNELGSFIRVFDITFWYDDMEIEPLVPVDVKITFDNAVELEGNNELKLIHLHEDEEAKEIEAQKETTETGKTEGIESLSFQSGQFSTYIVAEEIVVYTFTESGNDYEVVLKCNSAMGIPEDAVFSVDEITKDSPLYDQYAVQVAAVINPEGGVRMPALLDISLKTADGEKIELENKVQVIVRLTGESVKRGLQVVHFPGEDPFQGKSAVRDAVASSGENDEIEVLDIEYEKLYPRLNTSENTVTFNTDSFSVFALAYKVNFEYMGRSYEMLGNSEILLSKLLEVLEVGVTISDITSISYTGNAVELTVTNKNDRLMKVIPKADEESVLTIKTADKVIEIKVAATGKESVDLGDAVISSANGVYLPDDATGSIEYAGEHEEVISLIQRSTTEAETTETTETEAEFSEQTEKETTEQADKQATEQTEEPKEQADASRNASEEGTAKQTVVTQTFYQVYDISLENVDAENYAAGFRVEMKLNEKVQGDNVHLYHVHDSQVSEITEFDMTEDNLSFVTENFSYFVISYTVDFEYVDEQGETHAWSFPGSGSVKLVDMLKTLGIVVSEEENITIESVFLSEPTLGEDGKYDVKDLYLEQVEGEWYIKSENAFDDTYTLDVTVNNSTYEINVSDDTVGTHVITIINNTGNIITSTWHVVLTQSHNYNTHFADEKINTLDASGAGSTKSISFSKLNDDYDYYSGIDANVFFKSEEVYGFNYYGGTDKGKESNDKSGILESIPYTIVTDGDATTITFGTVGPVNYTSTINFYNENGANVATPSLSGTYYLAASVDDNVYHAQITGSTNTTAVDFLDANDAPVSTNFNLTGDASFKIVSGSSIDWTTFDFNSATSVVAIDDYTNITIPASATGGVYAITLSKPRTCTAGIAFKDTSNNDQATPVLDSGYAYYVVAVKNDTPVGYAQFTGPNATLNFTGSAPDDAATTTLWVVRSATVLSADTNTFPGEISALPSQDKVTVSGGLLGSYEFMWDNTPTGTNYVVTGKQKEINTIVISFFESDGTTPLTSSTPVIEGNHYIFAKDNNNHPKYYAPVNADGTIGTFKDTTSEQEVSYLEGVASAQMVKNNGSVSPITFNALSADNFGNLGWSWNDGPVSNDKYTIIGTATPAPDPANHVITLKLKLRPKTYTLSMSYDPQYPAINGNNYLLIKENGQYKYYAHVTNGGFDAYWNTTGVQVYNLETAYSFTFELVKKTTDGDPANINDLKDLPKINVIETDRGNYKVTMPTEPIQDNLYQFTARLTSTYSARINFYDAWSDTPRSDLNLTNYTLVGTDEENHTYTANVTNSGILTFVDGSGQPVDELPEIVTWKFYKGSAEITRIEEQYVLSGHMLSGNTYTFEARAPKTYSACISFQDAGGNTVETPIVKDENNSYSYSIQATADDGNATYTATVTGNGELTWEPGNTTALPKVTEFVFRDASDGTVSQTSRFGDYELSVVSYEDADLAQNDPQGHYEIIARIPLLRNVTFRFKDQDGNVLDETSSLTLEDCHYYLVATVGSAQDRTHYYAEINGSANAMTNVSFTDAAGNSVTQLGENATFELSKSANACNNLSDVMNNASVVSRFLTQDDKIYVMEDAAVSDDGTTYTLAAGEYVPSSQIDTVIVRLTDVAGNVIRPSTLPGEKLYVLAKLTTKGDSSDMKGWRILKIDNNAFNNEPVGEWSGTLNNQYFYFRGEGDNWAKSNDQGYSTDDYDLVLRLYKSNNDINVDEASAYNNLTAQGTDGAPEGYAFVGIFNHDGLGGARADASLPEKTALIRLRESAGAVYGMRAYVSVPGLTLTEADKYIVRVRIDHETSGASYAYGKLVVSPEAGPEMPVQLVLLSGKTQNSRSSVWHDANASQWVDTVTLNETNVTIELLQADGDTDAETLMKTPEQGHYQMLEANRDSIKSYTWVSGERQRETDEDGVEHVYDVIHLNLTEGDITVGEIQNALRNATNFGLYTENLLNQGTDMEANIAAAYVTGPVSDGYGFSDNNVFINSIKVTKRWTDANGKGKQGEVTLKLYPIEDYDKHSGTYAGLGTPDEKTGLTDANGRLEITFDRLAPGYYLLKEVQPDGTEVSFEDGANGVVMLGDNKSVTFSDGLLKISNINVNVNYFSDVSALGDDQVKNLLKNSRQGWVVTDSQTTYERLVQLNNMLNEAERSKVSMAGTADFPVTYNIPSDMAALRTLSGKLATEMSSRTVKVINTTAKAINDAGGMHITSDGLFVVMNIKVENASDVNPIKVETQVDGTTLDAEFGKTGSEYASKVLYNFINPDGTPYSGLITTVAVGSGILFAPAATVGSLGGNWGGTIVCKNADHTGSEIHSDNANKTIKINTMLSNTEAEHDVGDLRLEKQAIGDIMPDNTTWFTFKIVLKDDQGNPVSGTFNTSAQRNNVNTVTFTNGEATVDVRANNIVIINEIPAGYTYTVDELVTASTSHYQKAWIENKDGLHSETETETGTIEKGETAIVRIVNVRKVGGLSVTKTVVGDPSGAQKFEFSVTILSDDDTVNTEFNGSYGNMVFTDGVASFELGNGEFRTAKDIPTGTKFRVEEVSHDQNGFATVSKVYVMDPAQEHLFNDENTDDSITGEIIEYNNEKVAIIATFTNTHTNDATYMPKVTKELRQIDVNNTSPVNWPAEGFTFKLVDSSGKELGTAKATKDSPIASFDSITYQSEGKFTYTITEEVPQDAANSRKDGVIYHQSPLEVTVVVTKDETDPENPMFRISSVKYGDGPEATTDIGIQRASGTITNYYENVMAMPEAVKMLNGAEFTGKLSDGTAASFTFDLKEVNGGTVGDILQTVTTGENGTMTFQGIDYIEPGEHTYQIIERPGENTETILYDSTPVYWKVSVTDSENNRLAVNDEYYSDIACQNRLTGAVFNNIEKGKIVVTKTFSGITDAQIPTGFQIEAVWGSEGSQQSRTLKISGMENYEDVEMTGDGLTYTWTISNVPVGTPVTFTESGYEVTGYSVTTAISGGSEEAPGTITAAVTPNVVSITNTYVAGVELPATGGTGIALYTFLGLMIILLAGGLLVFNKWRGARGK